MNAEIQTAYNAWLRSPLLTQTERDALSGISDENEIADRFYKNLSFGTGGIRGLMGLGANRINRFTVRKAAYGLSKWLRANGVSERGVVIGFDTRNRSAEFAQEAADTLLYCGVPVYLYPAPIPTPMLSFSVPQLHAAAGIMITASHNPPAYNGVKVYDSFGVQLTPDKADALTACIEEISDPLAVPHSAPAASPHMLGADMLSAYLNAVKEQSLLPYDAGKDEVSIVYSPVHGAGKTPVSRILAMDGFPYVTLVPEQSIDDGNFPTVSSPNPEERSTLDMGIRLAAHINADIVLGTDPDGDRLGVAVLHQGAYQLLTGNQIGALLAYYVIHERRHSLSAQDVMVKTVVTGELGADIGKSYGLTVVDTLTGFKYIGELAVNLEKEGRQRFLLGYEESFGFLTGSYARDKDATLSAMLIAELTARAKAEGLTLLDVINMLYRRFGFYLDELDTVTLPGIAGQKAMAQAMERFRSLPHDALPERFTPLDYSRGIGGLPRENLVKFVLPDNAWIAVRPSGTEPKLKCYYSIRGKDEAAANRRLADMRRCVQNIINETGVPT